MKYKSFQLLTKNAERQTIPIQKCTAEFFCDLMLRINYDLQALNTVHRSAFSTVFDENENYNTKSDDKNVNKEQAGESGVAWVEKFFAFSPERNGNITKWKYKF